MSWWRCLWSLASFPLPSFYDPLPKKNLGCISLTSKEVSLRFLRRGSWPQMPEPSLGPEFIASHLKIWDGKNLSHVLTRAGTGTWPSHVMQTVAKWRLEPSPPESSSDTFRMPGLLSRGHWGPPQQFLAVCSGRWSLCPKPSHSFSLDHFFLLWGEKDNASLACQIP